MAEVVVMDFYFKGKHYDEHIFVVPDNITDEEIVIELCKSLMNS